MKFADFYYVENGNPKVETQQIETCDIYDIELPYKSVYLVKTYDREEDIRPGFVPQESKITNVKKYAIGLEMNVNQVVDEYGKLSEVYYQMLKNMVPSICVNPTNDWYVLISKDITPISPNGEKPLKYRNEKLFAEIYYNKENSKGFSTQGSQKISVVCEKPNINCFEIPQSCKNVSYINFFKIVSETKVVNGKKVNFFSEPVYLDKRYLIGEKIDFNDIDENKVPAKTYIDLQSVYLSNHNTTFCKTNFGITTLTKNEVLIPESKLQFEKSQDKQ